MNKECPSRCDHCQTEFTKRKEHIFDDHMWFCELCISCPNRWYVGFDWCRIHYQDVTPEQVDYNKVSHREKDYDDGDDLTPMSAHINPKYTEDPY